MNIFTIPYKSSSFYVRPDTSINRENHEYFCPSDINELEVSEFIYARASKAGKCIASKFAHRYYNKVGKGVQLTVPQFIQKDSPESWLVAHSLDSSTFIGKEEELDCANLSQEHIDNINNAFETVSRYISVRTGDYIAIEINRQSIESSTTSVPFIEGKINIIW